MEFENGGYAVFLKQTMEMMEYSARGKLEYTNSGSRKYYGGPSSYLIKENDYFVDTITNESFYLPRETAKSYSSELRENLVANYYANTQVGSVEYDYSTVGNSLCAISNCENNEKSNEPTGQNPKYDDYPAISIPESTGTYIPNFQYFLHAPRHGTNGGKTCGAVATQLLLSYHNYYSDRRIIDNRYLNGGEAAPNSNPNLCADPMRMDSLTLGTRGRREDGSDDDNSYFSYVVSMVPGSATTNQVRNGINTILLERNQEISGTIDYSLGYKTGGWFFGTLKVDTSKVVSEINSGRPSIILMQKSLGGRNHYVVAYGYCNYTYPGSTDSYAGFITHFGWDDDDINIWINSAWCYGYVTLKINHTHDYFTVGPIQNSNRTEYRCSTCGHRTDSAINMISFDRYVERTATISQSDGITHQDYYVTFGTAGNKLFQTFGTIDATLTLLDAEYKVLIKDDDFGYSSNSLFNYTVEANKAYILRVATYGNLYSGSIKVGITPDSQAYSEFEDILHLGYNTVGCSFTSKLNTTRIICYTPGASDTYRFTTESKDGIDTFLYFIDPTSTETCLFNDDGAGNYQAQIETDLVGGRSYLLIVSAYSIASKSGSMGLRIKNLSGLVYV